MTENQLSEKDIEVLIEAVDAWPSRNAAGHLMGSLLTHIMSKDEDGESMAEQSMAEKERELGQQKIEEQEIATLLKAKLIGLRRDIAKKNAQSVVDEFN